MIKAEVVFSGSSIIIGDYKIIIDSIDYCEVYRDGVLIESFWAVEDAVKYCLEN